MESGRDGMEIFNPDFFGSGRDGVFQSRFFRDGTGLKKNLIGIPISRFGPNSAYFFKAMLKQTWFVDDVVGSQKWRIVSDDIHDMYMIQFTLKLCPRLIYAFIREFFENVFVLHFDLTVFRIGQICDTVCSETSRDRIMNKSGKMKPKFLCVLCDRLRLSVTNRTVSTTGWALKIPVFGWFWRKPRSNFVGKVSLTRFVSHDESGKYEFCNITPPVGQMRHSGLHT